jgi:ketosteroid isomerase-like protein
MTTQAKKILSTAEVAARFDALAQAEKWFEIQDELFAENVKSIEPAHSPYMSNAEGKAAVRKKGEHFVSRIRAAHKLHTTPSVISAHHFAVGREMDLVVEGLGDVKINQIMLYEVKDGQIVAEQFFY